MAVAVSQISEFMFCPMKVYLKEVLDLDENPKNRALMFKEAYIDFRFTSESRARKIRGKVCFEEIEEILMQDLERTLIDLEIGDDEEIKSLLEFEVKSTSLKILRALKTPGLKPYRALLTIFPHLLREYPVYDPSLELYGRIDLIEIREGKYFPVKIKTVPPRLGSPWPSDVLEATAYGVLVEKEFETESPVSFIDYIPIAERVPVATDYRTREHLFDVLDEIRKIKEDGEVPHVQINPAKCEKCGLGPICYEQNIKI